MSRTKDENLNRAGAPEVVDRSRRGFLGAGLAGASVAVAGAGAAVTPAAASESDADQKKARYRETDHVKKYYATNRY